MGPALWADRYFPSSYEESRSTFHAACVAALAHEHGECASYSISYPQSSDSNLTIDTGYFSRGNPRLVILQSGLHGVEAFAGAAIQRIVFEKHLQILLGNGFDVLMIHAMNPYGFKNLRRVDGNNVDLNRNFATDDQPDFYRHVNKAYRALRDIAEPHQPVTSVSTESTNLAVRTLLAYVGHGFSFSYISDGTHAGQYEFPHGLEFGGFGPAQQTRFLRERIAPAMASHPGDILFLDLHTGLGAADTLTIYSGNGWEKARVEALRRFVAGLGHPDIRMEAPDESAFQTRGDVIDFVPKLVPGARVTAVTLEWGTIGEGLVDDLATNARMILENQAHFYGCANASICDQVRQNFVTLFNPPSPNFRRSVIGQADTFLTRLARLKPDELTKANP